VSSNRTTIIIAHRLATVRDADRILVMKDGQVIQDGQHEGLLKSEGLYAELIQAQQFDKRQEPSAAPSIMSSAQSSHKGDDWLSPISQRRVQASSLEDVCQ
jgi:ATP-binding cassette subfamily B (MDR/TAP) protein 1